MLKIRKNRIIPISMYENPRKFIAALGGYRAVARALNKTHTTVHSHIQAGVLPASWYDALCQMAIDASLEEPPRSMFSFLQIEEDAA
jgi:hypothetical protein